MSKPSEATLFCPKCSHAVSGPPESFAAPLICPGCADRVSFVDYSREKITLPPEPKRQPTSTWADQLYIALIAAAALLILLTLTSLWSDAASSAMWAGLGCLAVSLPLAIRYVYLQRELLHRDEAVKRVERALVVAKAKIETAAEINRGFQKNIEQVAAEERRRVRAAFVVESKKLADKREDVDWRMRRTEEQQRVVRTLGDRIVNDAMERISTELTARNFDASRRRLQEVISFCRENDCQISPRREEDLLAQLTHRYNRELRTEQERQRRDAVAARLQAEQRAQEQMEVEITRVEAQRSAIRRRLSEAQAATDTAESSSTTLKRLKAELQATEQKAREATAIAHQPMAGHILVLSNVGAFGEGVLKVCLSRRVDPREAVTDLARDATPFPFDIHMIVSSDRAADLIHTLHEALHEHRVNRVDLGKDFFRVDVDTVWKLIVASHGTVEVVREAAAEEFRESEAMSTEHFQHVTQMMRSRENWAADVADD